LEVAIIHLHRLPVSKSPSTPFYKGGKVLYPSLKKRGKGRFNNP
jgi:hypothetical protein